MRVLSLFLDSVTDVAKSDATYPSVASIPTRPSIAVPVFQAVAMPPRGATTIGDDARLCAMAATPSISIYRLRRRQWPLPRFSPSPMTTL